LNTPILRGVLQQPTQSLEYLVFVALPSEVFDSLNPGQHRRSLVLRLLQPSLALRQARRLMLGNHAGPKDFIILRHRQ